MVVSTSQGRSTRPPRARGSHRAGWSAFAVAVLLVAAAAVAVWAFSGVRLVADASSLGRVELETFAGSLASVQARGSDGRSIPLAVSHGRLTPRRRVAPGERIALSVVVRRPGWAAWALGSERRETLTVETPVAHLVDRWPTVARGAPLRLRFDTSVDRVSVPGATVASQTVSLPVRAAAGTLVVAAAARPWETLGAPVQVTWFPHADRPVVLASPGPNARISPVAPIRLTFSAPVAHVLGDVEPKLVPAIAGRWATPDGHTLEFRPSGLGAPFDSTLSVRFPSRVAVTGAAGTRLHTTTSLRLSVAPASFLRLQQLLAEEGTCR